MNVLITSGSIIETIDNVYYIGQRSNESIAAIIGEEFSKQSFTDKIFFLYGEKSRFPWESSSSNDQKFFLDEWLDKVALYPIMNMQHFSQTLEKILTEHKIDVIIHLMSIPNYGNTTTHLLKGKSDAIKFIKHLADDFGFSIEVTDMDNEQNTPQHITTLGKIKTGFNRVLLEQLPQQKVLSLIQSYSPNSMIISSKFEFDVSEEELIQFSQESMNKNGTQYVLASDIEAYKNGDEDGYYLIGKDIENPKRLDSLDVALQIIEIFL